jgi:hypothetical protein
VLCVNILAFRVCVCVCVCVMMCVTPDINGIVIVLYVNFIL